MSNRDILSDIIAGKGKSDQSFQDVDANTLIKTIDSLGPEKTNKLNQTLNELQSSGQSYKNNKKYREAAHLFYLGGMITKFFYPTNQQDYIPWFQNSINNLIGLSEEYMTWKEIDRASAVIALANILNFFTVDNWELTDFYTNFLSSNSGLIQQGKTASGSLWVPNFIVTAIKELNSETLQQADQYSQMYLFAEAKTTSYYKDGIMDVLNLAREKLSKSVQVPTLRIDASLPKDVLFGEEFTVELTLIREGQGDMKNVAVNFNPPQGINKISDNLKDNLKILQTSHQTKLLYKFSSDSSSKEEFEFEFLGNIQFEDLLGGRRSFPIGPFSLTIRSFRKADKLREQFREVENGINQKLMIFDNYSPSPDLSKQKLTLRNVYKNILSQIKTSIDSGNFEVATANIEFLNAPENLGPLESQVELFENEKKSDDALKNFNMDINNHVTKNEEIIQDLKNRVINLKRIVSDQ